MSVVCSSKGRVKTIFVKTWSSFNGKKCCDISTRNVSHCVNIEVLTSYDISLTIIGHLRQEPQLVKFISNKRADNETTWKRVRDIKQTTKKPYEFLVDEVEIEAISRGFYTVDTEIIVEWPHTRRSDKLVFQFDIKS